MENQEKDIVLIISYLSGELNEEASAKFIDRLKTDNSFKNLFEEQKILIEGIKQYGYKDEIRAAYKKYIFRRKIIKTSLWLTLATIATVLILYYGNRGEKSVLEENAKQQPDTIIYSKKLTVSDTAGLPQEKIKVPEIEENVEKEKHHITENSFNKRIKKPNVFYVFNNKDTLLECREGTRLNIPAYAFKAPENANIRIEITEYYQYGDMWEAQLSTTSEEQLLETGGMVNIKAFQDKSTSTVQLQDGKTIEIQFPYTEKKQNMIGFNGILEDNRIDWKPIQSSISAQPSVIEEITKDNYDLFFLEVDVKSQFVDNHKERSFDNYIEEELAYPVTLSEEKTEGIVMISFVVEKDSSVSKIKVKKGIDKALDKYACKFIKNTKWKPALVNKKPVNSGMVVPLIFKYPEESVDSDYLQKVESINAIELKDNDIYDTISNQKPEPVQTQTALLNYYLINTSKLGWINCDRFYRDKRPKITFRVKKPSDKNSVESYIIFKNIKSIMRGYSSRGSIVFNNVPAGAHVLLVTSYEENGKLYVSKKLTEINRSQVRDLNYKELEEVKLPEFVEELNKL